MKKLLPAPKHRKLEPSELKWYCDPDIFDFKTTAKLEPGFEIIGQEKAIKALKIGVDINSPGYNIFITGLAGTGKLTTIQKMLEDISPKCAELQDYVYVNNFADPDRPILLVMKAGEGQKFKNELKTTILFLLKEIPKVLDGKRFSEKKKNLVTALGQKQASMMESFERRLKRNNFTLGKIGEGEAARTEIFAVIEQQPVFIQQLPEFVNTKKISRQKAQTIAKKYAEYQQELQKVYKETMKITRDFQDKLSKLEIAATENLVKGAIDNLRDNFNEKVIKNYLDSLESDVLENINVFKIQYEKADDQREAEEGLLIEYGANVILDNSSITERPVIIETNPSYKSIFGTIEKIHTDEGEWYSDFTKIKAGSLLRANGGFLVMKAMDVFAEPGVWSSLKRVLQYGKLEIQDNYNFGFISPSSLKPEPIKINTKVILIGNEFIYSILSEGEDDFNKIFKIKAEFDYEIKNENGILNDYAKVIKKIISSENLLDFDKSAIIKLLEYSSRFAGSKKKLTTQFAQIADLIREANYWAKDFGEKLVSDYHIIQAYESAKDRHNLGESKLQEMIDEGTILIDTEGDRIGQINGLAVYGCENFTFGKPTRITASVSLGKGDILNVEREAGLSGQTHNKGVLIISGYFREKFGNKVPLSFNASLVFEQGYGMIDGDSASVTEICAIISCLANVPIKQYYAITGSVNQKGDIQPIGGVNEKIEGFFDVCKKRGLNGKHGVIIPMQNVSDLVLKQEVIDAVNEGNFSVYPVSQAFEAIELLTGFKAGEPDKNGDYPPDTIFGLVEKRLHEMNNIVNPDKTKKQHSQKKK